MPADKFETIFFRFFENGFDVVASAHPDVAVAWNDVDVVDGHDENGRRHFRTGSGKWLILSLLCKVFKNNLTWQLISQTYRQTDAQTNRQTDGHTYIHTDKQTDRQTDCQIG
jgi:hypothetical protein